jgi:hypothetical protein
VDFDLPEATALATYYLMRSQPNISIRLYGEWICQSRTSPIRDV